MKTLRFPLALTLVAFAAACGGGSGGSSLTTPGTLAPGISTVPAVPIVAASTPAAAPSAAALAFVQMSLTVSIPVKKSSSRARGPQYIAPNSGSMTMTLLTVNGVAAQGATQGPFNLTLGANNPSCTPGAVATTCTFSISAPVGTDIFLATTYANSTGTLPALGSGSILLSVRKNATNSANLSLTGPVTTVQVVSGTMVLYNGNPAPEQAQNNSGSSLVRTNSAADRQAYAAESHARAVAAAASRTTLKVGGVSPTPPPPGPVATSSRIFVIALDTVGNQIINPTTFDIPIHLQLNLNGLPAGAATLGVAYAGLTGEPTSNASTATDQGSVDVLAPADTVTLTLGANTSPQVAPFTPTVVANFTPQGGAPQISTPLMYAVFIPPPGAILSVAASQAVDPLPAGVPATLTLPVGNVGNAATTGPITLVAGFYLDWTVNNFTGSDPSWSCSNLGYEIRCTSSATIAPGGSLPLFFNVTPNGSTPIDNVVKVTGGGAVNASAGASYEDLINVSNGMAISPAVDAFNGTCPSAVPCGFSNIVSVAEMGYVGPINLTLTKVGSAAACAYFALSAASVADSGSGSSPVTITPIGPVGTPANPATCTLTATDSSNNTATSLLQNNGVGVTVQ